jgi:prevent-host-death family protein
MLRVKISELKNQLSRYLRAVKRGEVVEVMERNVAVARIHSVSENQPATADAASTKGDLEFYAEQFRLGVLKRGTGKIPPELFKMPPGKPGVLAALLAERLEGR